MKKIAVFGFVLLLGAALASAADVPTLVGPAGAGQSVIPAAEFAVLWDQPLSTVNQNAYVNQQFSDLPDYSSYLADDFVVPAGGWSINAIFVPNNSWNPGNPISCASMLHFEIYADNGGIPAGYPGGGAPVWSLAVSPTDAQITLTAGSGGFITNVLATLAVPAQITTAGTYWFIFYPTADFAVCGQYGRQPADTTNGSIVQFINPGGGFGYGTGYQSWAVIGATEQDEAFRLEGDAIPVTLQSFDIE
ncbi:MAG: hypothetical protein C3F15_15670 [Holophagae bacterium]|nr:MAG: hypothetical protein C3F15_15670 [Holophagae bacterium]